jgi:hypothetical protein
VGASDQRQFPRTNYAPTITEFVLRSRDAGERNFQMHARTCMHKTQTLLLSTMTDAHDCILFPLHLFCPKISARFVRNKFKIFLYLSFQKWQKIVDGKKRRQNWYLGDAHVRDGIPTIVACAISLFATQRERQRANSNHLHNK